tara:strand:+ start:156 stop:359 length:204 start_codon:yes stop_codon:yes gene_type:complete
MRKYNEKAPSPKDDKRGCLCPDGTYSRKCCDGSFQAQGIGSVTKTHFLLYTENREKIIQENGNKLFQ